MSGITLNIKGQRFELPAESCSTSRLIKKAQDTAASSLEVASHFFLAAAYHSINTTYYTLSTIVGTVKRFPTSGKDDARNFLNEEGMKALHSAVFTAAMGFLSLAALYDTRWSQSHINVTDPIRGDANRQDGDELLSEEEKWEKEFGMELAKQTVSLQITWMTLKRPIEEEASNESNPLLNDGVNFFQILKERYKNHFNDPKNVQEVIFGYQKILAGICFIREIKQYPQGERALLFVHSDLRSIRDDLASQKKEARARARRESVEASKLRKEQAEALKAAEEKDREVAKEKEALQNVFQKGKDELKALLERLEQVRDIQEDVMNNYKKVHGKTKGLAKLSPLEIYRFARAHLVTIDFSQRDLTLPAVSDLPLIRAKDYPNAPKEWVQSVDTVYQEIETKKQLLTQCILYAQVTQVFMSFRGVDPDRETCIRYGQQLIESVTTVSQALS